MIHFLIFFSKLRAYQVEIFELSHYGPKNGCMLNVVEKLS
jgi:hypothetical protein